VAQPHVSQEYVVPLLVQEQLTPVPETHVHLAIPVNVGRVREGSRSTAQHENATATDADEEPKVVLTPENGMLVRTFEERGE
jgi:hypothetical protein